MHHILLLEEAQRGSCRSSGPCRLVGLGQDEGKIGPHLGGQPAEPVGVGGLDALGELPARLVHLPPLAKHLPQQGMTLHHREGVGALPRSGRHFPQRLKGKVRPALCRRRLQMESYVRGFP